MEDASQLLSKIELDDYTITEVRNGWETVEKRLGGPREAGDFVFKLLKDAVPRTEGMLKRSSTVWHLLDGLMQALSDPDLMQKRMEYIALRHMNADVTTADVEVFKGILLEVCAKKLGGLMTPEFQFGLGQIVTAVGISLANTHAHYAQRLRLLTGCWKEVNATEDDAAEEQEEKPQDSDSPDEASPTEHAEKKDHDLSSMEKGEEDRHTKWNDNGNMNIPKTFAAMARSLARCLRNLSYKSETPAEIFVSTCFNASVMGIGDRSWAATGKLAVGDPSAVLTTQKQYYGMWFADLLYSMESLVPHIGNVDRVQEECDVLALTLAHYDKVNLGEFRSVMFASLRIQEELTRSSSRSQKVALADSLEPRSRECLVLVLDLRGEEGHAGANQERIGEDWTDFARGGTDPAAPDAKSAVPDALATFKLKVFDTFFASCEESQLYLRAANKRLQYIMGRILTIMSDVYTKTHKAVIAISALGLLHAGHGVPEDLVRPFVQAFMCSIKEAVPDESIHDGLWWTLDLIGRIFIRTLSEGSTPVIIAINKNNTKVLNTAVSNAPRGQREVILLRVQVGTESMSPLVWAVEKGALESAGAILKDLLTMRADRGRYYYGMEAIFSRHPDIIPLLCNKAPSLLVTLLDGLIWRSKNVRQGMRRVNYYISSMLVGDEGQLTTSLLDLIKHGDPEIVCHPAAVFQAPTCFGLDFAAFRGPQRRQTRRFIWRCHLPSYLLQSGQEMTEVILLILLLCMLCCEPVLHCLSASNELLVDCCEYGEWYCSINNFYNRLAAFPMLLYFLLASELVHLHVQLSVFSVICASLWWEFMLYLAVLVFFAATFAAGVACLPQSGGAESAQMRDFSSMPAAFESMLGMAFNTYGSGNFEEISTAGEPMLKWFVMAFAACWHVYLMTRGIIIYETSMPLISKHRWGRYEYLQYPAVELDRVQRYGGLANPELPWPNLEEALDDSAVGRLERLTKAKFEEMDRLMVDMAVKLGVRSASLSGGAGDTTGFSSAHGSTHRDNGESSHVLDGAAKDAEEELSVTELNEGTLNELPQDGELTEEGELLNETPYGIKQSNQSPFSVHG
ncbi:hypothetical protein AK812_SmicGene30936 [Symbiodinium microadriaticum]|uniref:Uncharacterized protein n=1 Tax=Symbiodinium microadriaticum TaxID=2951 RepID=A0A1Q9CY54_SYMMI|nr:hypothetical protein AK812_SmicGene30936 [Symbiodinium microadriaticum]